MDKSKAFMVAIGGKSKAMPPPLGTPGMKPKMMKGMDHPMPEAPEDPEPEEQSARDKLRYLRETLKECMAVLGEDEGEEGQSAEKSMADGDIKDVY